MIRTGPNRPIFRRDLLEIFESLVMQLSVKGKQLDIGDALRSYVGESLTRILEKYFGDAIEVKVTLSREGSHYRAVVTAHVGRGIQLRAQGEATEPD